jgi:hypothetical protein
VRLAAHFVIAEVMASVVAAGVGRVADAGSRSTERDRSGLSTRQRADVSHPAAISAYDITARRIQFYTTVLDGVRALPE